jgi:nucleoside-diphosphate-sugar epimerase
MSRILIVGTNSFVGNNFIKYSRFREIDEISLIDRNPEDINLKGYDVVIHLVAIVHQTKKISEGEYFRINRDLCLEIASNAKKSGVRQFVFLSTVKVYGKFIQGSAHWNEKSPCFPDDAYGKSKYAAEIALKELNSENFTVSIVRTPLVYGEGVRANMLNIMKAVNSSYILPFRNIKNRRNFTSAENLVGFIDRIIETNSPGIFIAMDKDAISTTDLVKMISENFEKRVFLFGIPDIIIQYGMYFFPRIFDRLYGSYEMDNSETLKILNFEPPLSTRDGVRRMVQSFKQKGKFSTL